MRLVLVRTQNDFIVGEIYEPCLADLGIERTTIINPMLLRYVQKVIPPKIQGQQPQQVTAFEFVPISCGEIKIFRVLYFGEIKSHDPVYVTYYKVLEAQKKQEESPLMVTQ
jgi:hypothetical protein